MSVRSARIIAMIWLTNVVLLLAATIAGVLPAAGWRQHVATEEPTPHNSMSFVEHGRTFFAPPAVVKWHDYALATCLTLVATLIVMSVIAAIASVASGAQGLRWRKRNLGSH